MFIRQSLSLPGIDLSYLEWKQGKKPLLLLHGLADNGLVWLSLGNHLAEDYHIIAPDLRGHGESSKPETGYRFANFIADLEALIQHLGWNSFQALGHSWSAKLLLIWATQRPELFRSLILVDPFFIGRMPNWMQITFPLLYRVLPFLQTMGPFPSYEAAEKIARRLKQYQGWTPLQKAAFQAGIEQKLDGTWGSKFTVQARNEIFVDVMEVSGLTEPLEIPTLFIKPERGLNRTQWQISLYQKYLRNLQIREVLGNHWPFLVAAEPFNQTVQEFVSSESSMLN